MLIRDQGPFTLPGSTVCISALIGISYGLAHLLLAHKRNQLALERTSSLNADVVGSNLHSFSNDNWHNQYSPRVLSPVQRILMRQYSPASDPGGGSRKHFNFDSFSPKKRPSSIDDVTNDMKVANPRRGINFDACMKENDHLLAGIAMTKYG